MYDVSQYFLEDVVQLLRYMPCQENTNQKRKHSDSRSHKHDESEAELANDIASEKNLNLMVDQAQYGQFVAESLAQMSERGMDLVLIDVRKKCDYSVLTDCTNAHMCRRFFAILWNAK